MRDKDSVPLYYMYPAPFVEVSVFSPICIISPFCQKSGGNSSVILCDIFITLRYSISGNLKSGMVIPPELFLIVCDDFGYPGSFVFPYKI